MTYEIPNINEIIITKTFELFQSPDDNNIFMQLSMLHGIKKEYIKLLENNKNDTENQIIDMFIELDNNELNYDLEINEDDITNMFKHFEDDDNDDDEDNDDNEDEDEDDDDNEDKDEDEYNTINDSVEIDVTQKFYVYFYDKDILHETLYRGEDDYGHVYYDVITYKGDVIDVIDECGDSYNIVKFEETGKIERISERMLIQKHYNAYREQVIPHKLNYFDF